MGILDKFGPEQGELHPGRLTWPGAPSSGLPVLGAVQHQLNRRHELDKLDVKAVYRARYFNTWEEGDVAAYCWVMERAVAGWFRVYHVERVWDDGHRAYKIWLEWAQRYATPPPAPSP